MTPSTPRRPATVTNALFEQVAGGPDPAEVSAAAHQAAWVVAYGKLEEGDHVGGDAVDALHQVIESDGLEALARLWSLCQPDSLPGALWRLYAMATWVRTNRVEASRFFDAGRATTPVMEAVAGVADPPHPQAVVAMIDQVMLGVAARTLGMTLQRVAAFTAVVAAGRAALLEDQPDAAATSGAPASDQSSERIAALMDTACDLQRAARRWYAGQLR